MPYNGVGTMQHPLDRSIISYHLQYLFTRTCVAPKFGMKLIRLGSTFGGYTRRQGEATCCGRSVLRAELTENPPQRCGEGETKTSYFPPPIL